MNGVFATWTGMYFVHVLVPYNTVLWTSDTTECTTEYSNLPQSLHRCAGLWRNDEGVLRGAKQCGFVGA